MTRENRIFDFTHMSNIRRLRTAWKQLEVIPAIDDGPHRVDCPRGPIIAIGAHLGGRRHYGFTLVRHPAGVVKAERRCDLVINARVIVDHRRPGNRTDDARPVWFRRVSAIWSSSDPVAP